MTGVGEVLKERQPDILLVAVEPTGSAILSGGEPGKHKIQGIGAGFVPEVLNTAIYQRVITIDDQESYDTMMELSTEEGLSVGISSGATVRAALPIARELGPGKRVVVICASLGERYLSLYKVFEPEVVAKLAPKE